ncbi:MAG TPA: tRNA (adenosine(37)-N6)-threonylcarbamoyltransferase complex transferase subunit TsaD [Candidatus Magasanikbacteria bacterium]|nr:tRNA (adenosine(37)-N6)-threonylcarbamoyltransferase complex transferase subunit TsaD [Candidatus Magasanikbacteria bacterium]
MKILAIESSCDDTSVALVECSNKGFFVIAEKTASQIDLHKKFGGVIPEIAGRMHAEKIIPLVEEISKEGKPDIITVASGPGLITGLIVGVETARNLSYFLKKPLVSVNHLEGHIHSVEIGLRKGLRTSDFGLQKTVDRRLKTIHYPALALIVSGGHTELILMKKPGNYKLIGATLDDAAGECFDKVAKMLKLSYPGGPKISILAQKGNGKAIDFPRPMLNQDNFNFSFSGLKTAVLYHLQKNPANNKKKLQDFCASFEQAIIDVLTEKTVRAIKKYKPKTVVMGGGVTANTKLRQTMEEKIKPLGIPLLIPELKYCMDNATMLAVAGYYKAKNKKFIDWKKLQANPTWEIG